MNAEIPDKKEISYSTSDIYFASYLCAIDIPMIETRSEDNDNGGKKIFFIFKVPKSNLNRLKAGYFGGSATVKVKDFVQSIRSLKSMCFI